MGLRACTLYGPGRRRGRSQPAGGVRGEPTAGRPPQEVAQLREELALAKGADEVEVPVRLPCVKI